MSATLALSKFICPTRGKVVGTHHVVVLAERDGQALILPTVSLSADVVRARRVVGEFENEDLRLAGWAHRCAARPEATQWVPTKWLSRRPGFGFSKATTAAMGQLAQLAQRVAPRFTDRDLVQREMVSRSAPKERLLA